MTTQEILEAARSAKSALALADNTARNAALLGMADALCSADDQAAILLPMPRIWLLPKGTSAM